MKIIMTMAAAVALTACGGGSDSDALSRADEGIWSSIKSETGANLTNEVQTVILSDGSYWGISDSVDDSGTYSWITNVLHGTANVKGSSVSGTYTDFTSGNGTYSGTVSAQNTLNLTFNGLPNGANSSFNMRYDSIYNQPASLAAIAGHYLASGYLITSCPLAPPAPAAGDAGCSIPPDAPRPSLTISGSNLALDDQDGNVIMAGTIAPHGTTVNVFDVNLTVPKTNTSMGISAGATLGMISVPPYTDASAGTTFKGVLFQTSSDSLKHSIKMIAVAGNNAYYFVGSK